MKAAPHGRSTRTFIEEGRWQAIVDDLRPGDYVFIQFGTMGCAALGLRKRQRADPHIVLTRNEPGTRP